jgi:hypothetical protein
MARALEGVPCTLELLLRDPPGGVAVWRLGPRRLAMVSGWAATARPPPAKPQSAVVLDGPVPVEPVCGVHSQRELVHEQESGACYCELEVLARMLVADGAALAEAEPAAPPACVPGCCPRGAADRRGACQQLSGSARALPPSWVCWQAVQTRAAGFSQGRVDHRCGGSSARPTTATPAPARRLVTCGSKGTSHSSGVMRRPSSGAAPRAQPGPQLASRSVRQDLQTRQSHGARRLRGLAERQRPRQQPGHPSRQGHVVGRHRSHTPRGVCSDCRRTE